MKHILTVMAALMLVATAFAQPPQPPQGQGPRGREFPKEGPQFMQMDPEQMAKEETGRLDKLVNLTPKQYKKLYRFNKRQYNQMQSDMDAVRPEGRPAPGEFRRPPMGGEMRDVMKDLQEKREKKYRKVLDADQYQKWEAFEAQRDFRRIVE